MRTKIGNSAVRSFYATANSGSAGQALRRIETNVFLVVRATNDREPRCMLLHVPLAGRGRYYPRSQPPIAVRCRYWANTLSTFPRVRCCITWTHIPQPSFSLSMPVRAFHSQIYTLFFRHIQRCVRFLQCCAAARVSFRPGPFARARVPCIFDPFCACSGFRCTPIPFLSHRIHLCDSRRFLERQPFLRLTTFS